MSERDEQVRAMYAAGTPMAQLVEHFGVSRQRIHQILRAARAPVPDATEVAARRKAAARARESARLDALVDQLRDLITEAATHGHSRAELWEAIERERPDADITHGDLGAVLARAGVTLPARREPLYSTDALKAALYYAVAASAERAERGSPAPDAAMHRWASVLKPYIDGGPAGLMALAHVVATGQHLVDNTEAATLAQATYLKIREQARTELPLKEASWPPDSVTIKQSLGRGTWNGALTTVGLRLSRGRPRGSTSYSAVELAEAMDAFRQARPSGRRSRAAYLEWRSEEAGHGRARPGVRAFLAHYHSWGIVSLALRREVNDGHCC